MIIHIDGDLFESPARVLVNTVNTRGVMGKGIALQFKQIYPEMFKIYREHCERRRLKIGNLHLYKTRHKWVLNFPTKEHWRNPSRVEYIEAGLKKFVATYDRMDITSIAFPPLGCGNGELDYETQVEPLLTRYLRKLPISTYIYSGQGHAGPPEHRNAKRIEKWLRSEPSALPFDEVWHDVVNLLRYRHEFKTKAKGNSFTIVAEEEPPAILVTSHAGKSSRIITEELVEFWQQLRDYGLTHSSIAPMHRNLSYLMPVIEQLPYVRPVTVSESSAARLKTNPAAALQVVPPAIGSDQPTWNLFGSAVSAA